MEKDIEKAGLGEEEREIETHCIEQEPLHVVWFHSVNVIPLDIFPQVGECPKP